MADYIRDEEEQAERLKEWWQKNGTATIVVIVLAIGSMIGWLQWQEHSSGQASGGEGADHGHHPATHILTCKRASPG